MTQSASTYARLDGDKYFTPAWVTQALFTAEGFWKVWDPAGGDGSILDAVPFGVECRGSDILPDNHHIVERDYFSVGDIEGFDVVTNPPYGTGSRLAVRFIEHSLALTRPYGGKVAMLLKVGFDSAKGRRHLFDDHPAFAVEHRLVERIRWANLEQSSAGPTENHSWFVWDWRKRPGPAVKGYLPLKGAANG